jgi:hypothetical protein
MAKSTAVAKQQKDLPAYVKQGKGGMEAVTTDDLIIPRLDLVQALSKARQRGDPAFIEGATEGDLFNSVTRQLYGQQLNIVPLYYKREFAVWKSRKSSGGGGFRGMFSTKAEAMNRVAEAEEDSLEIVETPLMFVVIVHDDGSTEDAVISMSRTKQKVARQWITLATMIGADLWAKTYTLSSIQDKNAKGDLYYNYAVKPKDGWTTEELYNKCAKRHAELFTSGRKVEAHSEGAEE